MHYIDEASRLFRDGLVKRAYQAWLHYRD